MKFTVNNFDKIEYSLLSWFKGYKNNKSKNSSLSFTKDDSKFIILKRNI